MRVDLLQNARQVVDDRVERNVVRRPIAYSEDHKLKIATKSIKVKAKERIVLREIHLRTTGRHLSMGSHSVISATRQR